MSTSTIETSDGVTPGMRNDPKRLGRVLFGALFLAIFIGYYFAANDLADGTLTRPGPGLFPHWVGIAGIVISLIVIGEALIGRSESGKIDYPRGQDAKDIILFTALTVLYYAVFLTLLGQYISSVLFAVAYIRFVGRDAWWKSIVIGAGIGLILTFFFSEILGLPLPSGTLLP